MLLRSLADQLIIFREGGAEFFNGTYDEFLEKIGWEDDISDAPKIQKPVQQGSKKEQKQQRAEIIQERSRLLNPLKKEIDFCENTIMELEEKLKTSHEQLIKYSNEGDSSKLMELSKSVAADEKMIEELFERLEIASNEFERITKATDEKLEAL